ncbi:DUF4442 domain-containing protein [Chromobacterium violaceum]|uniref:DUF4442 domain-containing protein n=2 Tax=Chromobacterium violaceum TaxID=536 RepID=A0A1R0MQ95_CHRVL|nr:DUF4442 domain-containing protein [Chromobacterium violaceum]AAQ61014.1 conserved hypothetical protein [Chromobacterium violaceum ATCC 12472]KJH66738.1 tetrameric acyl-CoA thioesterase [Chromobacterium violaceum]MBA8736247.1 DUF4442 domain-containing protein [Chromobacterium violaceum]MBP4045311.1 DUF4442 domain-containing protein [Chromobacterium violaceum]MBT2867288.1 DUF4442 domain-containing protein [Chromobacterium violaceum]
MNLPIWLIKLLFNLWPPFLGAGIRVHKLSPDFRQAEVRLKLGLGNRNYVGTHFGGSLYAMTDPFYMLMLLRQLGGDYYVWDKAGRIDYVKPGRGVVRALFHLSDEQLADIRERTAGGDKHLPEMTVEIRDADDELVATVHKTLYVRRKPDRRR